MSQQNPQPTYQAQSPMGQQFQQTSQIGQAIGYRFEQSVPQEVQNAVMDLDRLESVCEWVKSRATERGRSRVAQRADDLANIAHLEKKLLLRGSPFAEPIGRATKETIQQAVQEFQQHVGEPETQEALTQAQQTLSTIGQALGRVQQWGQQGTTQQGMTQQVTPQQGTTGQPYQSQY